ncbi:hypothetical protein [Carboxylicivirga sp. RSCT41]|uniref:hypothetical protein n=1 Tax=Carboxylicivirga agarovorans TaxID=3417570 RepID=UPI003D3531B1
MKINKSNYEAYLLDYLEGSISAQDREALLLFFELHPELKSELDTDISLGLNSQEQLAFGFKEQLLKHDADIYELPVSEYLYIKKQEDGLSKAEETELLVAEPDEQQRKKESAEYGKTILKADHTLFFADKSKLRRFILLPAFKQYTVRRSIAAVAVIALFTSIWFFTETTTDHSQQLARTTTEQTTQQTTEQQETVIAQSKILEKSLPDEKQPSKDSLLKLAKDPMELKTPPVADQNTMQKEKIEYLAGMGNSDAFDEHKINAYEHGLNVMMPQYMNNNLLRQELASIYRQIEVEDYTPSLSLALVESGVKVMNFLSKDPVKMQKYYNDNGEVVAYKVKGENLEVNRKIK